jgi:hypothetical protein
MIKMPKIRTYGIARVAVVVTTAACLFVPERALAGSVIDAAIKPYFVLGGLVTALVFLSVGYFISAKAIRNRRMAVVAEQWPTTDGTVISTDVVKCVSKSQDQFDYFVPQIRYAYTAKGMRRQGDVIRIGLDEMGYLEENKAREHIRLYPAGSTIPVRYDPQDPEHAVLETGHVGVTRKIFAGFIFAGIGIAAIVFSIWSASLPTR